MIKPFNTHQFQLIGKLVTPDFLVTVARFKKNTENKLKVYTNIVHASVNKIICKETPKRLIQCYNCTECSLTFDTN